MKTAIYIRVSTEEQAKEGYSISAQTQKLKAFCISQGWDVVGLYADEGISAKDMERPRLQQMLKDIQNGMIECVLVYRLDRLTRSVLDLYKMLEIFEKYDCKFKSATEVYDTTTAMGRMFITIVAALAQWERENMGERIAFGFAEKVRQGKYAHNFAPMGYNLNKEESKLYINHSEAKTVRLIFDLYKSGLGMNRVARKLNTDKILTKANNQWTDDTVKKILRSHAMYGAIKWNDMIIENAHEPIIPKEEWLYVQDLIKQRTGKAPRSVSSRYIYSGKIKCPSCGNNLSGTYVTYTSVKGEKREFPGYRCRFKMNGKCDFNKLIQEKKVESAFIEYLGNVDYASILDEVSSTGVAKLNKEIEPTINVEELERKLKLIEKRKKKWQYAWTEDVMSYEDFKKRMEEAAKEENEIKEILEEFTIEEVEEAPINKEEIIKALKDIKRNWDKLETNEKKNLVNMIIEEIHYTYINNIFTITDIDFIA